MLLADKIEFIQQQMKVLQTKGICFEKSWKPTRLYDSFIKHTKGTEQDFRDTLEAMYQQGMFLKKCSCLGRWCGTTYIPTPKCKQKGKNK